MRTKSAGHFLSYAIFFRVNFAGIMNRSSDNRKAFSAMRYASLATQWLVMLGLAVWAGLWLDRKAGLRALFVILLPLLALVFSLYNLIKTFSKKDSRHEP